MNYPLYFNFLRRRPIFSGTIFRKPGFIGGNPFYIKSRRRYWHVLGRGRECTRRGRACSCSSAACAVETCTTKHGFCLILRSWKTLLEYLDVAKFKNKNKKKSEKLLDLPLKGGVRINMGSFGPTPAKFPQLYNFLLGEGLYFMEYIMIWSFSV